jgi:hypothetical protein
MRHGESKRECEQKKRFMSEPIRPGTRTNRPTVVLAGLLIKFKVMRVPNPLPTAYGPENGSA